MDGQVIYSLDNFGRYQNGCGEIKWQKDMQHIADVQLMYCMWALSFSGGHQEITKKK